MNTQNLYQTQDYFTQMHRTYGDHAISGILFGIASIFQEEITKQTKAFPVLYLNGGFASGKTSLSWAIQKIAGSQCKSCSFENSTIRTINKLIDSSENEILCIEEYTKNEKFDYFISNFWDRCPILKGNESSKKVTGEIEIKSSLIIISYEKPISERLKSRVLAENLKADYTSNFAFNQLHKIRSDKNVNIKKFLKTDSSRFDEDFKENFDYVKTYLNAVSDYHFLSGRQRLNITILLAVFKIFEGFNLFPFDFTDAVNHFVEISKV